MKAAFGACLAAYAPHLLDEHLTGMHDDPIIVAAFRPLADLAPRAASYAVFQAMMIVALGVAWLVSLGGKWRDAALAAVAVAMVCELHHAVRALATLHVDSGLFTSPPMVVVGALVLRDLARRYAAAPAPIENGTKEGIS